MSLYYDRACQPVTFPLLMPTIRAHAFTTYCKQKLTERGKTCVGFGTHYAKALMVDMGGRVTICFW